MIFIQLIGIAALLLDIASVQFKFRKHILLVQIIASCTWVMHFAQLGAVSGAAMNAVGVIRSVCYYLWRTSPRPRLILYIIILLSIAATVITWQGFASIFPMMAMIIAAVAFWQKGEQSIRVLLLIAAPLWFAYNVVYHSYAGMLSDGLAVASSGLALYRYRRQGISEPASSRKIG